MIHGADGSVQTLCLDLDTSKRPQLVVDHDAASIATMLDSCGLRFVADHSPSGGRHIYIPLSQRLSAEDARELVEALGSRFESIDPGPHQNITDGCIRTPGSWHKSMTGHQVLDTPLSEAYDILRRRNSPDAVSALRRHLAPAVHRMRAEKKARKSNHLTVVPTTTSVRAPSSESVLLRGSVLRQVARTGMYNAARYKSASEARMAVLNHLCAWQMSLAEIQNRVAGDFIGLASLYGTPARMERLLPLEWQEAADWVGQKNGLKDAVRKHGNKSDTEPALNHSGGADAARSGASISAEINDLENVLYSVLDQRLARTGREGITLRFLLRAVIGFARTKQTLIVDVGCRAFALEMGIHHGTIARLLPRLAKHSGGVVTKIEDARGKRADSYLLGVPEQWKSTAQATAWRKGRIFGIRPVFRALGASAALVYEAIERGRHSPNTSDIIAATGLSRPTVAKELNVLAELSMVERHHGNWQIVHTTDLKRTAEWLGVQDEYEDQKRRVRAERRQWHAHLERFTEPVIHEEDIFDQEKTEWDSWDPHLWGDDERRHGHLLVA